jgi:hypothetical protein
MTSPSGDSFGFGMVSSVGGASASAGWRVHLFGTFTPQSLVFKSRSYFLIKRLSSSK